MDSMGGDPAWPDCLALIHKGQGTSNPVLSFYTPLQFAMWKYGKNRTERNQITLIGIPPQKFRIYISISKVCSKFS
jgi:hypothetical protein